MTSKEMKAVLEDMGFVVAHVRRRPRSIELRAYLAMTNDSHPDVDEIRYTGDGVFHLYEHAVKANGYGQYDKYVGAIAVPQVASNN